MVRKTKEETENTKTQIVQAALDCFYEKGFSKTTFDDIATRIGMTKGAIYWHFKDKAELLVALIKMRINDREKRFRGANASPQNIAELKTFFGDASRYIESNHNLRKFLFFITMQVEWSDSIFNKVTSQLGEIRNFDQNIVLNALSESQKKHEIDPQLNIELISSFIVSSWKGAITAYVSDPDDKFKLTTDFLFGLDLILNGLKRGIE